MKAARRVEVFRLPTATTWSLERIELLSTPEVRALHANAERLEKTDIATLCVQVLTARPRGMPPQPSSKPAVKRKKRKPKEED